MAEVTESQRADIFRKNGVPEDQIKGALNQFRLDNGEPPVVETERTLLESLLNPSKQVAGEIAGSTAIDLMLQAMRKVPNPIVKGAAMAAGTPVGRKIINKGVNVATGLGQNFLSTLGGNFGTKAILDNNELTNPGETTAQTAVRSAQESAFGSGLVGLGKTLSTFGGKTFNAGKDFFSSLGSKEGKSLSSKISERVPKPGGAVVDDASLGLLAKAASDLGNPTFLSTLIGDGVLDAAARQRLKGFLSEKTKPALDELNAQIEKTLDPTGFSGFRTKVRKTFQKKFTEFQDEVTSKFKRFDKEGLAATDVNDLISSAATDLKKIAPGDVFQIQINKALEDSINKSGDRVPGILSRFRAEIGQGGKVNSKVLSGFVDSIESIVPTGTNPNVVKSIKAEFGRVFADKNLGVKEVVAIKDLIVNGSSKFESLVDPAVRDQAVAFGQFFKGRNLDKVPETLAKMSAEDITNIGQKVLGPELSRDLFSKLLRSKANNDIIKEGKGVFAKQGISDIDLQGRVLALVNNFTSKKGASKAVNNAAAKTFVNDLQGKFLLKAVLEAAQKGGNFNALSLPTLLIGQSGAKTLQSVFNLSQPGSIAALFVGIKGVKLLLNGKFPIDKFFEAAKNVTKSTPDSVKVRLIKDLFKITIRQGSNFIVKTEGDTNRQNLKGGPIDQRTILQNLPK